MANGTVKLYNGIKFLEFASYNQPAAETLRNHPTAMDAKWAQGHDRTLDR